MKVLYSCLSRSWGGLEMTIIQGAEQLLKRNILVDVLCYPGSQINIESEKLGINCINLKASSYFHPFQVIKLAGLLGSNSYNLIHTQLSKDLWVLVPSLNYLGSRIPLILTKQMGSSVIKKDLLHKWLYNRVNYVLAISNVIRENVLETCPVTKEKVILHFNSIDLNKYIPSISGRNEIRKEFDIKDTEIVIGMLARITYGKGYEELLQAAKKLCNDYSNLRFVLVGSSSSDERDYEARIKGIADQYNISDKVIFTGFRKDTVKILAAMDIFAFPSHAESFGYALVEAMAMEKPSVGTNAHGILDIINDGTSGYLFNNKDSQDLEKKLRILIESPDIRIKIGKAARKQVIEKFDLEKQTQKLVELYNKLVS